MNPNTSMPVSQRIVQVCLFLVAAIAMFGAAVMQTNLLRPDGWIALGLPVALLGLLISFPGSRALVRRWRTPPGA